MANILLVEGDERQIEWAKMSFERHNLKIVVSYTEYMHYNKHYNKEGIDYIITGLTVPYNEGEVSKATAGLEIFKRNLERFLVYPKYVKGLALISNFYSYDRYYREFTTLQQKLIDMMKEIVRVIGKEIYAYYPKNKDRQAFHVYKRVRRPKNILFFHNNRHYRCENLMSPEETILNLTLNEVYDLYTDNFSLIEKEGYINLKPFKEILAALQNELPVKKVNYL